MVPPLGGIQNFLERYPKKFSEKFLAIDIEKAPVILPTRA